MSKTIRSMVNFAHEKIKKAREEPNSSGKVQTIRSMYGDLLRKLPQQELIRDWSEDLWDLFNHLNNIRRITGTSEAASKLEDQQTDWLKESIDHMA